MEYSDEFMRDYLLGKIDKEQQKDFEEKLNSDRELFEALQLQEDILTGIRAGFDEELKKKLMASHEGDHAKIRTLPARNLWRWASAAAIVLGTIGVYYFMSNTSSPERIYYSYFEHYPNIISPAQRDDVSEQTAYTHYDDEKWEEALADFEAMETLNPENVAATFYKGVSAMHLEHWDLAIEALEKVSVATDIRFIDAANWYKALAYLRSEQEEKATLIFEMIGSSDSPYRSDSEEILQKK